MNDRNVNVIDHIYAVVCRGLKRKLLGNRGYISRELFERLYNRGIQLITRLRKHYEEYIGGHDRQGIITETGGDRVGE